MKNFEFNEHNVCTNPNTYRIFEKGYSTYVEIRTAFTGEGWVYAVSLSVNNSGMSSCCGKGTFSKVFETEKQAFYKAIEDSKIWLTREKASSEIIKSLTTHNYFPSVQQLELF